MDKDNISLVFQLQTIRELLENDIDENNIQETCLIMNKMIVIESKLTRNKELTDNEKKMLDVFITASNENYFK